MLSDGAGVRIDRWLNANLPGLSRTRIQALLKSGNIRLDGRVVKAHCKLAGGETVSVEIPEPRAVKLVAQSMPLDILYEDSEIVVVNKAAGMVVHPAAGHDSNTLVNALLHHCGRLGGIGGELRPGIVHRLDKDTSGVLVVAKTDPALQSLQEQFKKRAVRKEYLAVVWGHPKPPEGRIETGIGRSDHDRKKMSVHSRRGRNAVTCYETVERFSESSMLRLVIETGRTHQIRVHLAHLGCPVLGDAEYGGGRRKGAPAGVSRQMLHAHRLEFTHPATGKKLECTAPLPDDMEQLLLFLRTTPGGPGK